MAWSSPNTIKIGAIMVDANIVGTSLKSKGKTT
ncbi:hypothetical protein SAMN04489761_2070 [Tenacibaculum sp. MAR_2009_124]|nr:hypothetical protein SAMN04489761_2070 [Tenacibaculum sp. MAR_2009_124]